MTMEFLIKDTIRKLKIAFPQWSQALPCTSESVGKFEVISESGKLSLTFVISDRVNVKIGKENLEYFEIQEGIDKLTEIVEEKIAVVEYLYDSKLPLPEGCEITNKLREYQWGNLCNVIKLPIENTEMYFANKINIKSWKGTYDTEIAAIYKKS